jgi:hypothetical protein
MAAVGSRHGVVNGTADCLGYGYIKNWIEAILLICDDGNDYFGGTASKETMDNTQGVILHAVSDED